MFMFKADLGLRRHRFGSLSSFMQIKATVGIKAQEVKKVYDRVGRLPKGGRTQPRSEYKPVERKN